MTLAFQPATKAQLAGLMPSIVANLAKKQVPEDGPDIAAGRYRVQATAFVEIDAFVTQGEGSQYTPTEVPLKAVLAIAIQRAGIGPDSIQKFIAEIAAEALKADKAITKPLDDALEKFKQALATTATGPKKTRKGAFKVEGEMKIRDLNKSEAA